MQLLWDGKQTGMSGGRKLTLIVRHNCSLVRFHILPKEMCKCKQSGINFVGLETLRLHEIPPILGFTVVPLDEPKDSRAGIRRKFVGLITLVLFLGSLQSFGRHTRCDGWQSLVHVFCCKKGGLDFKTFTSTLVKWCCEQKINTCHCEYLLRNPAVPLGHGTCRESRI